MPSIRSLEGKNFTEIHEAFQRAFADYALDMSYLTRERLENRMIKNGVDLSASRGVFDGETLAGFTLVGVGRHGGVPAAFDAGTGIIPEFRGQGLAQRMFEDAIPTLLAQGIEAFYLEVLQENEPAIRAYQKAGFSITRELDCFRLALTDLKRDDRPPAGLDVVEIERESLPRFASWVEFEPSWENGFESMARIPDELLLLGARVEGEILGFLAYYPLLNWVLCLGVAPGFREGGVAEALVAGLTDRLQGVEKEVKLNNLDRRDTRMRAVLDRTGFTYLFSQFEMMRTLE